MIFLNVGCQHMKLPGFVNIDLNPYVNTDLVCDALHLPYEDNSVDYIVSTHCIEHTGDFEGFNSEMHRVLKPGCFCKLTMPWALGRISLSADHNLHIKARNFYQYEKDNLHKKLFPNVTWEVGDVEFKHCYPFRLFPLWLVGEFIQFCLDLGGKSFRESYECHWGWLFPMQEFTITLKKPSDIPK